MSLLLHLKLQNDAGLAMVAINNHFDEASRLPPIVVDGHSADAFIAVIERMLESDRIYWLGPFTHLQLYSGPVKKSGPITNKERALRQAAASGASVLDATPLGQFMDNVRPGQNIYDYFISQKKPLTPETLAEAVAEADKVMAYVSWRFLGQARGDLSTAVCGAGLDRYFWRYEMFNLVTGPEPLSNVKSINGIPIETIRDLYKGIFNERYTLRLKILEEREEKEEGDNEEDFDILSDKYGLDPMSIFEDPNLYGQKLGKIYLSEKGKKWVVDWERKLEKLYESQEKKPEDAFRMICIGELQMALNRVEQSGSKEDYQDFADRLNLYETSDIGRLEGKKKPEEMNKAELYMLELERAVYSGKKNLSIKITPHIESDTLNLALLQC
jgi:hypothetical protein